MSNSNNISEDWTKFAKKQILSIGKKRQRIHDAEEDDDDDAAVGGEHAASSDEEEEGRTSAFEERKTRRRVRPPPPAAVVPAVLAAEAVDGIEDAGTELPITKKKKQKKKKGKKERAKVADEEATPAPTEVLPPMATDGGPDDVVAPVKNDDPAGPGKKKRYRKKTRSRQKNVRRDTRAVADRPPHLVVGAAGYAGRSLTAATRQKLGYGAAVPKERGARRGGGAAAFGSGAWVGGEEGGAAGDGDAAGEGGAVAGVPAGVPATVGEDGSSERTAVPKLERVGDCVVGGGSPGPSGSQAATGAPAAALGSDQPEDAGKARNKDAKGKKKRQRKFKNLVVG